MRKHWSTTPRRGLAGYLIRPWVVGPLLFIVLFSAYLLSFNVEKPTHNADWYIRYQVTCAIVEHNDFTIKPYQPDGRTGPGVGGRSYSQYTLGQTTAMIPFYVVGRLLAGVSHTDCSQVVPPPQIFLVAKLLNLVLGALIGVLFFATARLLGYSYLSSFSLTLLLAFGTSLWPDILSSEEHTMESLFLLTATYAALQYTRLRREGHRWVFIIGLAAGLVFVTRVAGIIALPIFPIYFFMLHRRLYPQEWKRSFCRDMFFYAIGVLPSVLINATFDVIRFGSPLRTGPRPDQSLGFLPWLGLPDLLISPGKGLLWYTPALLLLFLAGGPFRRRFPLPATLFAVIAGVYLLFYSNVNYWHGDPAWGPRYLYAILPYALLPLGEVWGRWAGYKPALRALIIGVLACSFLVQFSAVTVSYWRHWHFIYGYHYDQVENHAWGQNLNYWWIPTQSPILVSLQGIAEITQRYVDHAPLLVHAAGDRLSNPSESCSFVIRGEASLCLTDLDELRYGYNWNTFIPWWLHTFPWWSQETVIRLALGLVTIFIAATLALLAIFWHATHSVTHALRRSDGHTTNGNGHGAGLPPEIAALPALDITQQVVTSESQGGVKVEAPPTVRWRVVSAAPTLAPITGLAPLGLASLIAVLAYGGIMNAAALSAPHQTPQLVRPVPVNTTVRDGNWSYRIIDVKPLPTLPADLAPPLDSAHHYVAVTYRLYNMLPRSFHVRLEHFALTDAAGLTYPRAGLQGDGLRSQIAELYHLTPFGMTIPARSSLDSALVYIVRNETRHLQLLGPGIALVQLT